MSKMVSVVVSGYFDPIHKGHIEMFEKAKALGDKLIVIMNSDAQAIAKKGKPFMQEDERKTILEAIRHVDEVVISIDKDRSVCETLRMVHPDIFANGGDRFTYEVPETILCRELGIEIVDGLGNKIQSSSDLTGLKSV
ncbi:adenylyltransferase/cytidyltransferase family protein [archaeon]|jgi:cytidyltransferase-like protein|nr:adenylyltransferase/cytidyltransferase family protein [archaeon]MBT6182667.1 adenylyltransferase/cytidyltransferase family protein [archaeon]MBT6606598.1 adenylyltransferase/cytidyltransferase family protein [archaeon]MBT7251841.1 adenylyltransferase/cytidyltransferase family protein [archaeon]MBT7661111.1 adenylyltransferase/cytidyltransferase family protein [archaeon]